MASAKKWIFKLPLSGLFGLSQSPCQGLGKFGLLGRAFLPEPFLIFYVRLHLVLVFKVERDGTVNPNQRSRQGKRPQYGLGGFAGLEGADNAVERNASSGDIVPPSRSSTYWDMVQGSDFSLRGATG